MTHFAFVLALWSNVFASEIPPRAPKCQGTLDRYLASVRLKPKWTKAMGDGDTFVYRSPTDRLGHWIEIGALSDGSFAREYGPKTIVTRRWSGPKCTVDRLESPLVIGDAAKGAGSRFADADLAKMLADPRPGLIVVWSPRQVYSMEHYDDYAKLARRLKLNLTYLVTPFASEGAVRAVQNRSGARKYSERRLASVELVMRDGATHAPTAFVYGWNKISPPIVGVMDQDTLTDVALVRLAELSSK